MKTIPFGRYPQSGSAAEDWTSSVNFDGYIEAAARETGSPDGIRPAIRLSAPPQKEMTE